VASWTRVSTYAGTRIKMEMKVLVVSETRAKPLDTYVQEFEGLDDYEAVLAAEKNLATYDRLLPGKYLYEVIALGLGGTCRSLTITEKPVDHLPPRRTKPAKRSSLRRRSCTRCLPGWAERVPPNNPVVMGFALRLVPLSSSKMSFDGSTGEVRAGHGGESLSPRIPPHTALPARQAEPLVFEPFVDAVKGS